MRHNKAINHLGRKSGHRKALLANMSCSVILHKRISTTVAKAKALKILLGHWVRWVHRATAVP